jgi:hypothetical protein
VGEGGRRWRRTLGLVAAGLALFVTTAGACQREPEGPLPTPDAMGARPFPDGATVGGLQATYARLTREEPDGEQCFRLLRLATTGEATLGDGCSREGVGALAADQDVWLAWERLGDYAHRDGRVWVRIVAWDALAEEFVLDEFELASCGDELRTTEETRPFLVVHPYRLVTGVAPPQTTGCEGSP